MGVEAGEIAQGNMRLTTMTSYSTGAHEKPHSPADRADQARQSPSTYGFEATPSDRRATPRYVTVAHGVTSLGKQWSAVPGRITTPLPKRPKGQLLTGAILLAVLIGGVHVAWRVFLRRDTYGIVSGRVVSVSSLWDGNIQQWHVQEGDIVKQGQLLLVLHSPDLERRIAHFRDELRLAKADLIAATYELQWRSQEQNNLSQQALSEYYQKWATLLEENAELAGLESRYESTLR